MLFHIPIPNPPCPPAPAAAANPTTTGRMPKLNFPHFDGDNPRLFQSHSEKYFAMYDVSASPWLSIAEMHLDGADARRFQSLATLNWTSFCRLLHDRFRRDQKELLIRQPFSVRQTASIVEYVTQFTKSVDQLAAYSSNTDPMYFTMRFMNVILLFFKLEND